MSDFPKFQYSYFIANGAQLVVRTDDYSEFLSEVKRVQEDFIPTTSQSSPKNASTAIPGASNATQCPIHHKDMKQKVSKAGKPYTAHWKKLPDGSFDICFGKGWQSERPGQSSAQIAQKLNKEPEEETVEPEDIPF